MSEALVAADMVPVVLVALFVAAVVPGEGSAVSPGAPQAVAEVGSRR